MRGEAKIGTSGFQYPEWKGKFYPADLPLAKMLPYYADRFPTTEINYTFRTIPSLKTLERWAALTPESFIFSLKGLQRITHFARLKDCENLAADFFKAVSVLEAKLGPVLFQLPPNFQKDVQVLAEFLAILPAGMRSAFEFRHESWFADSVYDLLHRHNAALCIAESADLKTPFQATADFGYLRLRREDYSKRELQQRARKIEGHADNWKDCFLYFKHEEKAVGPRFAAEMQQIFSLGRAR